MAEAKPKVEQYRVQLSAPQYDVLISRSAITANIAGQGGGKTTTMGCMVGWKVQQFPDAKGFIGANTYKQLSDSTMSRIYAELEKIFGWTEYDAKNNPNGHYVIDKKPPSHWKKAKFKFKDYNGIMSFWNGARVFTGSLDNYKMHDGKEFAWAHLDETKDTKKEALTTVILGRLRQKGLWVTADGKVLWNENLPDEVVKRQGLKAWNPLYIHTSPAEGNVEWLIELLGIAPYAKDIMEAIIKPNDYFFKQMVAVDPETKSETETTVVISSTYHNEHRLPPDFISKRKAYLSKSEQLKFIYGYPFGRNGGEYFPEFNRYKHCEPCKYVKGQGIASTWDFNATPYITCLLAQIQYVTKWIDRKENRKYLEDVPGKGLEKIEVLQIRFFKEYVMFGSSTEETADAVADDFEEDQPDIFANGDANGHKRIEGLPHLTQYKIIENKWRHRFYLVQGWLRAKRSNIANIKRRDMMNRIWEGKMPEVEVIIDSEKCPMLVRDCENVLYDPKKGGKHKEEEVDKNGLSFQKLGHTSDAMEYLVCEICKDFFKD